MHQISVINTLESWSLSLYIVSLSVNLDVVKNKNNILIKTHINGNKMKIKSDKNGCLKPLRSAHFLRLGQVTRNTQNFSKA